MVILQIFTLILIVLLLIGMMARVRPWKRTEGFGKSLHTVPLGLLPKILTHRSSLMALLTGCILSVLTGWLPLNMALMVIAFALIILLMPMNYTLTNKGIAIGDTLFHSWNEFSGFKATKSTLTLAPSASFSRITLFVKPAEMDNVLKYVERHIKVQSSNLSIKGE